MNEIIDLKQVELHFEKANDGGNLAERGMTMAVTGAIAAGEELIKAKALIPHGEWEAHRGRNWMYGKDMAARYMRIASNLARVPLLKDAASIREALRMIAAEKAESEPETAPRSERKTGQVEVVEPVATVAESATVEADDDPTPDKPTIRTTATGSEKVAEDKKPRTAAIVPEILPDEPETDSLPEEKTLSDWCEHEILEYLVSSADDAKRRAKALRKAADLLDPPTKFVKPTVEDVAAYCAERKNSIDPEAFIAHYDANGWRQSNGNKCQNWKAAVITWEKRDKENGKGKQNGNATASSLGSNSRPPVERAKINYK